MLCTKYLCKTKSQNCTQSFYISILYKMVLRGTIIIDTSQTLCNSYNQYSLEIKIMTLLYFYRKYSIQSMTNKFICVSSAYCFDYLFDYQRKRNVTSLQYSKKHKNNRNGHSIVHYKRKVTNYFSG